MNRLPWADRGWTIQLRCKARLSDGTRCRLLKHDERTAHAALTGRRLRRWDTHVWTEDA